MYNNLNIFSFIFQIILLSLSCDKCVNKSGEIILPYEKIALSLGSTNQFANSWFVYFIHLNAHINNKLSSEFMLKALWQT